jgi:hypothetical protein
MPHIDEQSGQAEIDTHCLHTSFLILQFVDVLACLKRHKAKMKAWISIIGWAAPPHRGKQIVTSVSQTLRPGVQKG